MSIRFTALPENIVARYRQGNPDANGQAPEINVASDSGLPCRYCLADIKIGEKYLTLAHRPFPAPQPYAEVGPVFLHADGCPRGGGNASIPVFLDSPHYIIRGYGENHRIVYGTGKVVPTPSIPTAAAELFKDQAIAYIHIRSASNNCYHCRIDRT